MSSISSRKTSSEGAGLGVLPPPLEDYFQGVRNRLDTAYANFRSVLENEYLLLHSFLASLPPTTIPTASAASPPSLSSSQLQQTRPQRVVSAERWNNLSARQEKILESLETIEQRVLRLPVKQDIQQTSTTDVARDQNLTSNQKTTNKKINRTNNDVKDTKATQSNVAEALAKRQENNINSLKQLLERVSRLTTITVPVAPSAFDVTSQSKPSLKQQQPSPKNQQKQQNQQQQQPKNQQQLNKQIQAPKREEAQQKRQLSSFNDILYYHVVTQVKASKPQEAQDSTDISSTQASKSQLASQEVTSVSVVSPAKTAPTILQAPQPQPASLQLNYNSALYYSVIYNSFPPTVATKSQVQPEKQKELKKVAIDQRWMALANRQDRLLQNLEDIQKKVTTLEKTHSQSQSHSQPSLQPLPPAKADKENIQKQSPQKKKQPAKPSPKEEIRVEKQKETTIDRKEDNTILYYYALSNVKQKKVPVEKIQIVESPKVESKAQNSLLLSAEEREEIENDFVIIPHPSTQESPAQIHLHDEAKPELSKESNISEVQIEVKSTQEGAVVKPEAISGAKPTEEEKKLADDIEPTTKVDEKNEDSAPKSPQVPRSPGEGQSKKAKRRRNRRKAQNEGKTYRIFPGGSQALVARRLPELRATEEPLPAREYRKMMEEKAAALAQQKQIEETDSAQITDTMADKSEETPQRKAPSGGFNPLAGFGPIVGVDALKSTLKKVPSKTSNVSGPPQPVLPASFDPNALRANLKKSAPKVEAPKPQQPETPPKVKPSELKKSRSLASAINEVAPAASPAHAVQSEPLTKSTPSISRGGGGAVGGAPMRGMDVAALRGALKKTTPKK